MPSFNRGIYPPRFDVPGGENRDAGRPESRDGTWLPLFPGIFFPEAGDTAHPGNFTDADSLLREVSRTVVNLNEVEKQIKTDASLVYRLLRYLNSSAFFFTAEIRSVRHALMVLGEKQIRKWVALVVTLHA